MGVRDPPRRCENQRPVIALALRNTKDRVTGERGYESPGARLRAHGFDALLQVTNSLAQCIAKQAHAMIGGAKVLTFVAADRAQTDPRIPVAGITQSLQLG